MTELLLVEDEAMLRLIAAEMLQEAGFVVHEAANGVEALEQLEAHPETALLVTDVQMPRMGGYELVDTVLPLRPDLKILLMTGYTQNAPGEHLVKRGVQILYKPFNLELLCSTAKRMTAAS
ncbi:MAG TPA: response regulator [Rhizomicrobium sp.]